MNVSDPITAEDMSVSHIHCPECGADLTLRFRLEVRWSEEHARLIAEPSFESMTGCPHADAFMRGPFGGDDDDGEPVPIPRAA